MPGGCAIAAIELIIESLCFPDCCAFCLLQEREENSRKAGPGKLAPELFPLSPVLWDVDDEQRESMEELMTSLKGQRAVQGSVHANQDGWKLVCEFVLSAQGSQIFGNLGQVRLLPSSSVCLLSLANIFCGQSRTSRSEAVCF